MRLSTNVWALGFPACTKNVQNCVFWGHLHGGQEFINTKQAVSDNNTHTKKSHERKFAEWFELRGLLVPSHANLGCGVVGFEENKSWWSCHQTISIIWKFWNVFVPRLCWHRRYVSTSVTLIRVPVRERNGSCDRFIFNGNVFRAKL